MGLISSLSVILIIVVSGALLYFLAGQSPQRDDVALRPHRGFEALKNQNIEVVEGGQEAQFSLGRGSLASSANPSSLAALIALDYLAADACVYDVPPVVTCGDGTLLVAGQDSLRGAYEDASRSARFSPTFVRFLASDANPMVYAAGVTDVIGHERVGSNLALGRFGSEIAIIAEAADRKHMQQVIGSDDPTALALATPVTDKLLIGEELFASGAYLQAGSAQIASIQVQDILRVLVAAGILLATLFNIVSGL